MNLRLDLCSYNNCISWCIVSPSRNVTKPLSFYSVHFVENLLMMSIVFLVVCGLFFVISVVMSLMLIRRSRLTYGSGRGYDLEITEEKFQSMYRSSEHAEEKSPAKFEQLKLNDVSNGVHDSIDDIKSSERQNNNMGKTSAPPGTEKGQKDTKTLSSFHNKAYQSTSMQSGMDLVESDVKR
ncbi:unnamed protein product [Pocillopora meandrina]|uniref:Uncharacterized protein n=1 Tax=Pocillopora meandrina TaxID=46732 RepID=A0AAU9XT14_9CNID|nr:unnamed protein product [Pocillopora meandrina]